MVSGSDPPSAKHSLKSEESRQLSLISGAGITRCGHIERKDLGLKSFSVSEFLPMTSR